MLMAAHVPDGQPTTDDVKKILLPMVELDADLRAFLIKGPKVLTQKYWVSDFTDFILHHALPGAKPAKELK